MTAGTFLLQAKEAAVAKQMEVERQALTLLLQDAGVGRRALWTHLPNMAGGGGGHGTHPRLPCMAGGRRAVLRLGGGDLSGRVVEADHPARAARGRRSGRNEHAALGRCSCGCEWGGARGGPGQAAQARGRAQGVRGRDM